MPAGSFRVSVIRRSQGPVNFVLVNVLQLILFTWEMGNALCLGNYDPKCPVIKHQDCVQSESVSTVFTGSFVDSIAGPLGQNQHVCHESHLRITLSHSNLHDMQISKPRDSISRSRSAAARVSGDTALECMAVF